MADHNDFGNLAEEMAAKFLIQKNYRIVSRNYHFQKAEIDIIAEFEGKIIIVEVKARANDAVQEPFEAVNKKKIRLLVTAADQFMQSENRSEEIRFDIISVLQKKDSKPEITHIEDAFEAFDAN